MLHKKKLQEKLNSGWQLTSPQLMQELETLLIAVLEEPRNLQVGPTH